jgi:zinc transport system permease protein
MQLALIAGVVVGAVAPLIGAFLVQKRLALVGDGIGHVAVAGVGAGLLFGTSPVWTALVVAVAGALGIEWLRTHRAATGDLALALFFYGGIAAGVVLASRSALNTNLQPYLFGSILTIDARDVWTIVGLGLAVAVTVMVTRRALFATVFDEDSARVQGLPVDALNYALAALTALTIVVAMRVVGVLLIAALMVLPIAASRLFARSFAATLMWAAAIGASSAVLGLWASRVWALAPGGAIVLAVVTIFAVASLVTGARRASGDGALLSGAD